jgi:hypothetical protein
MRTVIFALIGWLMSLFAISAYAASEPVDSWKFKVLLDGKEIGRHDFVLRDAGTERELVSTAEFKVKFLFINAYSYDHRATERWRGDCLKSLTARTDDNGDIETLHAELTGEGFAVKATSRQAIHGGCVRSFAYWNPQILTDGYLLNAQTGEYAPVKMTSLGEETILVRGRPTTTQRYRLSGPGIAIELWYAGDRDWVALESKVANGRLLRYEIL